MTLAAEKCVKISQLPEWPTDSTWPPCSQTIIPSQMGTRPQVLSSVDSPHPSAARPVSGSIARLLPMSCLWLLPFSRLIRSATWRLLSIPWMSEGSFLFSLLPAWRWCSEWWSHNMERAWVPESTLEETRNSHLRVYTNKE